MRLFSNIDMIWIGLMEYRNIGMMGEFEQSFFQYSIIPVLHQVNHIINKSQIIYNLEFSLK
jgi:hypothetical protein